MNELLNKIKGDFFSIMAPGFYLLVVLVTFVISILGNDIYSELVAIINDASNYNDYWPVYLLAIFLSYLLGHFLRAVPVRSAEKICKNLKFLAFIGDSLDSIYYSKKNHFPYHESLNRILNNLQEIGYPEDFFSLPPKNKIHTFFNFMKSVLCAESPNAFAYTQTLENRVRLFSGMFWSTILGIVLCIFLSILSAFPSLKISWTDFHSGLIISSIIICALLGAQLPRVRGQEAEYVFLSYLSYIAKSHSDSSSIKR